MIIHHGQFGSAVDKTKEEVKNKLDANGVPEEDAQGNKIKLGEGAFTVANLNDTDNDGHADYTYEDHEANAGHAAADGRDETDLIKVILKKPSIYVAGSTLTFEVSYGNGSSDSAKVWKDKFREEEADVSESFSFPESETERVYWVELISPSAEIGDYHFSYSYDDSGFTDYANATAVWASLTAVEHNNRPAAEILTDPKWTEVTGGTKAKLEVPFNAGLMDQNLGLGLENVIYFRYTVTPPRIHAYEDIVKVDIGRRKQVKSWVTDDAGNVAPGAMTNDPWPLEPEFANDDGLETDESGPGLTDSDYIFGYG